MIGGLLKGLAGHQDVGDGIRESVMEVFTSARHDGDAGFDLAAERHPDLDHDDIWRIWTEHHMDETARWMALAPPL